MKKKISEISIVNDWFEFICILGLTFFLIVVGVWVLPRLPEEVHLWFSLSIFLSSIYFIKQGVMFLDKAYTEWRNKK